jgi:hypothetical protein
MANNMYYVICGASGTPELFAPAWSQVSPSFFRTHDLNLVPVPYRGEETTAPIGVAGRTVLVHQKQQAVTIAINPDLDQALGVP